MSPPEVPHQPRVPPPAPTPALAANRGCALAGCRALFTETERVDPTGVLGWCVAAALSGDGRRGRLPRAVRIGLAASAHLLVHPVLFPAVLPDHQHRQGLRADDIRRHSAGAVCAALGAWFIFNEPRYQDWTRGFSEMEHRRPHRRVRHDRHHDRAVPPLGRRGADEPHSVRDRLRRVRPPASPAASAIRASSSTTSSTC